MSFNNNQNVQANQPPSNEPPAELHPQFQMMLDAALSRQAAVYENTMKQMAEEFTKFKMNANASQNQPAGASNTQQALAQTPVASRSKGKGVPRKSVPITPPSAPPEPPARSKKPPPPQTRRAEAVAANLKRENFRRAQSEPLAAVRPAATPKKAGQTSTLPKGSPSTAKKKPNQMTLEDYPKDFLDTKECLFTHIRLLWGMVEVSTPPPAANPELVRQFCTHFQNIDAFQRHADDSSAAQLITQADVNTLKDARAGRIQVGHNFVFIDDSHIAYMHGYLAKLGIRCWGPNLEEGPESLFNSACRMAALNTFRQVAGAGGYDFMNFNRNYLDDMVRLIRTYNHYVHHVSWNKFSMERKQPGKCKETAESKSNAKNRARLRDARYKFAVANDFPERYKKIIQDANANSDDEWDAKKNRFAIRTLPYRSNAANIFFRRLDLIMRDSNTAMGKASRMRVRKPPKKPIPSKIVKIPKSLPLDFYHRGWLHKLPLSQQQTIPDLTQVAFLSDPERSLFPKNHPAHDPAERLSDRQFSKQNLAAVLGRYNLNQHSDEESGEEEDENVDNNNNADIENGEVVPGGIIDLEAESDYYEDGEWGNLYQSDEDPDYTEESGAEDANNDEEMRDDGEHADYGGRGLNDEEEDAIVEEDEEEMF
ncbi:hypothetical protein VP01_1494g1 [Puccinia sorghi]|uniref:Uncharacterized protein n=1 Tax=Puccinia sorghi TaxID=27349 RepID=A0A0L6VJA6_9BASI|nr:hypothetical protein VP01_1494g1 [Puccinia sorghi]